MTITLIVVGTLAYLSGALGALAQVNRRVSASNAFDTFLRWTYVTAWPVFFITSLVYNVLEKGPPDAAVR